MVDGVTEKLYNPYMTNKALSYFADTVLLANEMNVNYHLDNRLQYDFLKQIVRKRKRFSRWHKISTDSDIETIKEYYGYSNAKARDVLDLHTKEQLVQMKSHLSHGGRRK